jgi:hypothetical protein
VFPHFGVSIEKRFSVNHNIVYSFGLLRDPPDPDIPMREAFSADISREHVARVKAANGLSEHTSMRGGNEIPLAAVFPFPVLVMADIEKVQLVPKIEAGKFMVKCILPPEFPFVVSRDPICRRFAEFP